MYWIKQVSIEDLWGSRKVSFQLGPGANFLVGRNGSGKTAVIRIIAAALTADTETLAQLPFENVVIDLIDETGESSSLEVRHTPGSLDSTSRRVKVCFQGVEQSEGILKNPFGARLTNQLARQLAKQVKLTWLNVDRQRWERASGRELKSRSLDETLGQILSSLAAYFSEVKARVELETEAFLKSVFLNLLPPDLKLHEPMPFTYEQDREALLQIFQTFGISDVIATGRLDTLISRVRGLTQVAPKLESEERAVDPFGINAMLSVAYAISLHAVVESWTKSVALKNEISALQNRYIDLLNSSFVGKSVAINKRNEVEFILSDGRPLPIEDLSSGEKQMFIILSEALLQDHQRAIYLADEPELSLHIQWQESLVGSLTALNPEAQILFSTHSPDIIGPYQSNVIDMTVEHVA